MYIKESPVISVRKEYAGFQLDTSKIELHTADKRKILLPYSGELPEKLRDNDGAFVSFVIRVGLNINVHLVIKNGKKEAGELEGTEFEYVFENLDGPIMIMNSEESSREMHEEIKNIFKDIADKHLFEATADKPKNNENCKYCDYKEFCRGRRQE